MECWGFQGTALWAGDSSFRGLQFLWGSMGVLFGRNAWKIVAVCLSMGNLWWSMSFDWVKKRENANVRFLSKFLWSLIQKMLIFFHCWAPFSKTFLILFTPWPIEKKITLKLAPNQYFSLENGRSIELSKAIQNELAKEVNLFYQWSIE